MLDFIKGFAEESGNDLAHYVAPVSGSEVADERGEQVNLLCDANASAVSIRQEAGRLHTGRGSHCGAHSIWSVGIDDRGNHQKCREAVDKHPSPSAPHETGTRPTRQRPQARRKTPRSS